MIPALVTLLQQFDDNERSVERKLFLKARGGELTALIIFISLVITQIFRPEQLRDPSIGSRGRQNRVEVFLTPTSRTATASVSQMDDVVSPRKVSRSTPLWDRGEARPPPPPPRSPHRASAVREQPPELGVTNEILEMRPSHRAGDGLSAIVLRSEAEESSRTSGRGEADGDATERREVEAGAELEAEGDAEGEVSARSSAVAWEAAAAAAAAAADEAEAEAAAPGEASVATPETAGETPRPLERRRARGGSGRLRLHLRLSPRLASQDKEPLPPPGWMMESPGRWVSPSKQLSAPRRAQSFSRSAGWILEGPGRWVRQALGAKPLPVELAEPQFGGRQAPAELREEQPDLEAGNSSGPSGPSGGATAKHSGEMRALEEGSLSGGRLSSSSAAELATHQPAELAPQPELAPQTKLVPQPEAGGTEAATTAATMAVTTAVTLAAEAAAAEAAEAEAAEAMAARVVVGGAAAAAEAESAATVAKAEEIAAVELDPQAELSPQDDESVKQFVQQFVKELVEDTVTS